MKAKHWMDFSSEEIASILPYTSREPDWKSVFRLWYAQELGGRMELASYTALTEAISGSRLSLYCHLVDFSDYWKAHEAFFRLDGITSLS